MFVYILIAFHFPNLTGLIFWRSDKDILSLGISNHCDILFMSILYTWNKLELFCHIPYLNTFGLIESGQMFERMVNIYTHYFSFVCLEKISFFPIFVNNYNIILLNDYKFIFKLSNVLDNSLIESLGSLNLILFLGGKNIKIIFILCVLTVSFECKFI